MRRRCAHEVELSPWGHLRGTGWRQQASCPGVNLVADGEDLELGVQGETQEPDVGVLVKGGRCVSL